MPALPYRTPPDPAADRPALPLPPARMPLWRDGRPLKRWRYVGVFGARLMACFAEVRIAGLPQSFWAVWDREGRVLHERTRFRAGAVRLGPGAVRVQDAGVALRLGFDEAAVPAVETVSRHGDSYAWTRKRAGVPIAGSVVLDGVEQPLLARGVIDDSAGYHARETAWSWSAGVGRSDDGRDLAWNLVSGIHDAPRGSERTLWIDGRPREVAAVRFDDALERVEAADGAWALRCRAEAVRERDDRIGPVRSRYRQPFGRFEGALPGGLALAEGFGVMERHDVRW